MDLCDKVFQGDYWETKLEFKSSKVREYQRWWEVSQIPEVVHLGCYNSLLSCFGKQCLISRNLNEETPIFFSTKLFSGVYFRKVYPTVLRNCWPSWFQISLFPEGVVEVSRPPCSFINGLYLSSSFQNIRCCGIGLCDWFLRKDTCHIIFTGRWWWVFPFMLEWLGH